MKNLSIIFAGIVAVIAISAAIYLIYQGRVSRSGSAPGLIGELLAPCPGTPNCVCSEHRRDSEHYLEPIEVRDGRLAAAMQSLALVIREIGGNVDTVGENYIAATFSSTVFGFVDDVEFRADAGAGVIHVRSASRVGRSDLGANRRRVELIRQRFLEHSGAG